MAKQEVLIDDVTREPIEDGRAVQLIVKYPDPKKGQDILDVSLDTLIDGVLVEDLAKKGRHQGAAGRRAKK